MAIFKYEMLQLRSHTIWWSIAVAVSIFVMLPTYIGFMASSAANINVNVDNSIFEMFGLDIHVLASPVGTFGFLTAFFVIAAGINGMFLGLKTFTKETVQKSAEFIYTKPYKRSIVFCAKVLAAILSTIIIGVCYCTGSIFSAFINITGGFDFKVFSLIALSFILIEIFFVLFGAFIGVIYSKIRTPLLVSSGVAFMFYVLSAFASKIGAAGGPIKYMTPYSYFGTSAIVHNGAYTIGYMIAFTVFCLVFTVVSFLVFIKKDVSFVS